MPSTPLLLSSVYGVLVAEDNPDDERLTLRGLGMSKLPLEITVARDGEEALTMLEDDSIASLNHPPRLLLLDLKLPKVSGLEILEKLRKNPRLATMPVVCLTSSGEISDNIKSLGLGANSFVRKPIDYEEYLRVVSRTAEYWLSINYWPA